MKFFSTLMLFLALALTSYARPMTEGFSGYFDLGLIGISSDDALMVSGNNEEINNLSGNSDRFGQALAVVLFDLNYKSGNVLFHTGVPMASVKPELLAGATLLRGVSKYDFSLVLAPVSKVWEDPYVSDRDDTKDYAAGFRFKYEGIGGTPHLAELKIMAHDIDNDKIGDRYSSMARDGYTTELSVGYEFAQDRGSLTPIVKLSMDSRDGDAESNKGISIAFIKAKMLEKGLIIAVASIDYEKYDAENPIFNSTREDIKASAFLNYKLINPFGLKNKHISFMGGAANRASNIDFYDALTLVGGVTFGFDF